MGFGPLKEAMPSEPSSYISAATANPTSVKTNACVLDDIVISNVAATVCYLKLYDTASTPTASMTPKQRLCIPGATTGAGLAKSWVKGLTFSAGLAFRITTGAADADTGAVGAGDVLTNLAVRG